ncbi:hypothetical protein GCM10023174_19920 [Chelativorans composti]
MGKVKVGKADGKVRAAQDSVVKSRKKGRWLVVCQRPVFVRRKGVGKRQSMSTPSSA